MQKIQIDFGPRRLISSTQQQPSKGPRLPDPIPIDPLVPIATTQICNYLSSSASGSRTNLCYHGSKLVDSLVGVK
jgi:hypothetical protein